MSKLRVHSFSISIDGYGAGLNQDLENPIGVGGLKVLDWFFPPAPGSVCTAAKTARVGVDDDIAARGFENIGSYILGRNMFGPVRGAWEVAPDKVGKAGGEMSRRITPGLCTDASPAGSAQDGGRHHVSLRH